MARWTQIHILGGDNDSKAVTLAVKAKVLENVDPGESNSVLPFNRKKCIFGQNTY